MRELLEITKALSNPNRIRILMALTKGELCVCQIIAFLNLAPSTVSKHLSLLTQARLIENRKEGRWIFYCLSKERKVAKQSIKWIKDSLKEEEIICPGNRFIKYALFPVCNIFIQEMWGLKKQNTVFTVGKSIFNKTSKVNIGELLLQYGGGGHANAGTCQVPNDEAGAFLPKLVGQLKDKKKGSTPFFV